jgi:uncharacterized protein (DUF433 family)
MKTQDELNGRIVQNPTIMVGKPVVKGTRIPVETVLSHLVATPDFADLHKAFPHLTEADVKACLAFARDRVRRVRKAKLAPVDPLKHSSR